MFATSFLSFNNSVRIPFTSILLFLLIHVLFVTLGVSSSIVRTCNSVTKKLTVTNESFTDILYLDAIDGCDVLVSNVQAIQILVYDWTQPVTSGETRIRIQDVTCIRPNDGSTPCVLFNSFYDAPGAVIIVERVKFDPAITNSRLIVSVPLGFKNIAYFSVSECSLTWSAPASATKRTVAEIVSCGRGLAGVDVVAISSNSIIIASSVYDPLFRILTLSNFAAQPGIQRSTRIDINNNKIIITAATADIVTDLTAEIVGGKDLQINTVDVFNFGNNEVSLPATIGNTGSGNLFVVGIEATSFDNSNVVASGNILTVGDAKGATCGLVVMLFTFSTSSKSSFSMTNNTITAKFTSTGAAVATSALTAFVLRLTAPVSQISSAVFTNNSIQVSGAPAAITSSFFAAFSTCSGVDIIWISGGSIQTTSTITSSIQVFTALVFFVGSVDTIPLIFCTGASVFVQSVSSGLQQIVGVSFQTVALKVNSVFVESCHFEYWAEGGSSSAVIASSLMSVTDVEIKTIIARNCTHYVKCSGSGSPQAVAIFVSGILQGAESIFLDRNEVKVSIEKSSVEAVQLGLFLNSGSKLFGIENSSAPFNATLGRRPLLPINITINNNHVIFSNRRFSVPSLLAVVFYTDASTPSASVVISNNRIDSFCAYRNGTGNAITTAIANFGTFSSQSGTDYPLTFLLQSNEVISRGIYSEGSVTPVTLLLGQLIMTTGKILVRNNSITMDFSAPNFGALYAGQVTFTGRVLMKDELFMTGNKFLATFCSDPLSKAGSTVIASFMISGAPLLADVEASLRIGGDLVQLNGQPAKFDWSSAMMASIDYPIFSQSDQIDFPIHLENCTLIGNVDENYILHNTRGYNTKTLSQYELLYGNVELTFLRFASRGGITAATTISTKLIGNRIKVLRCAVSEIVLIRFATFTQSFLAVSSLLIFNNSISVPTSASLFNPTTTSSNQPNIISRLFLADVVVLNNYDNLALKTSPKILNNAIEISRTGFTASSLVYPTSATKFDYSVDPWNRVAVVSFVEAAPFSVSTPFEITGNRITATMEEANYVGLVIAKIWSMDLSTLSDSSPALLMESNVIEIGNLESFYHQALTSVFDQETVGVNSVNIKRNNNKYATSVISISNNSLVVSSILRAVDGTCAIFVASTDSFSLPSISVKNNFVSVRSIVATGIDFVRPQIGIVVVVTPRNTNDVEVQYFFFVQNLEVQNNFLEFGSCAAPNSSAGVCEIATVTMSPRRNAFGAIDSPMSIGRDVAGGNVVSGMLFLKALSNNTIKLMSNNNNSNAQSSPIINSTEFYCFSIRVEHIYSISGASNIFGNRISFVLASTINNSNNINSNAVQRNSIHSSNIQVGIVSFSKCVNKCFVKNNTLETSGLYFFSFSSSSTPSKIYFFIAQINASTREFIAGLQQHNFVFENNSIRISTNSSNENNNNIQTSILRLSDAPPTRLMLISPSSSISFDPTTQSSSVDPISILLLRNEIYSVVFTLQPTSSSPNIFTAANKNDGIVNFLFLSTQGSVDLEEFRILASLNNNTEVSGSSSTSAMIGINRRNVSVEQLQTAESRLVEERKSKAVKNLAAASSFSLSGNRLIKWPLKPNKIRSSSIVDITARGSNDVLISSTKYSSALAQDSFWTFGCNYWMSDIQKQFSLRTLFEMDDRQFKFNCAFGPSFSFSDSPSESPSPEPSMSVTSKSGAAMSNSPSEAPSISSSASLSMSRSWEFTHNSSSLSKETASISPTIPPPVVVSYGESPPVGLLGTVAIVAAASLDPASAAYMNRMLMLTTACGENDPHLPPLTIQSNPTTISLGSPRDDSSDYRGCVLGNSVVIVGVACFGAFVVAPFVFHLNNAVYDRNVERGADNENRIKFAQFSEAAAKIKFPGLLFVPTRILLSPTVFAIGVMIGLYFYANPSPLELAKRNIFDKTDIIRKSYEAPNLGQTLAFCLSFVVFILVPTFGLGRLSKKFGDNEKLEERHEFFNAASKGMCPSISAPLLRLLAPIRIWCPTSQQVMQYGMIFKNVSKPWFVVFDLTTDAVIALVNGIAAMTPNKSSCEAARFISLIACVIHFLVLLTVRPHLSRFSTIMAPVLSFSSVILASMAVASFYEPRNALLGATNNFLIFAAVTAVISAMESILKMAFTWYITNRVLPRLQQIEREKADKMERRLDRQKRKQEKELEKLEKQQQHQERKNEHQKHQHEEKMQRETNKKKFEDLKSRFMKILGEGHGRESVADHDEYDDDNTLELRLLPQEENNISNVQPNLILLQREEDEKSNSTLLINVGTKKNEPKSHQQARSNSSNETKVKKVMKRKRKSKPLMKSVAEIRKELDDDVATGKSDGVVAIGIPSQSPQHQLPIRNGDDDDDDDSRQYCNNNGNDNDDQEEDLSGESLTESESDRLLVGSSEAMVL